MKISLLLTGFLLFVGSLVSAELSAQSNDLDSIKNLLYAGVPDSTRIWAYGQVIWPYTRNDPAYALKLTGEMMDIAKKAKNERWIRRAQYYYAVTFKNTGELNQALPYIDSVYYQSEVAKDTTLMAYSSYQKAVILKEMGRLEEATEWFNITIAHYNYLGNDRDVAMCLNAKAGLYRQMKLYSKAIDTYNNAFAIYNSQQDSMGLSHLYNNLGNVYSEIDSFEIALEYYGKQEELNLAMNDTGGLGFCYENRGRLFDKIGRLDEAIASLEKSVAIRRGMDQKLLLANSLFQLGSSQRKRGLIGPAERNIKEGLEIAIQNDMAEQLRQGYFALSEIYSEKGDYRQAYESYLKQAELKDSLLNSTISEQALKIDALTDYETVQREQQINLLAARNEIQELHLQRSRNTLILALVGISTLAVLLIWIYRSRNRIKKLYAQLEKQQKMISDSLREKEFLLREIHHRVKNNLQVISSLLKLQSRSMSDKLAQQALDEGRHRVRSMALIHQNLYQDENNLSSIKVLGYLDQLTTELMSSYKVNHNQVRLRLDVDDIILDVDSIVPIGLIVNELVSNSLKYAFPDGREGEIAVSLHRTPDKTLNLKVVDNGVGYQKEEINPSSFGHRLIRALSERLKAEYRLEGKNGSLAEFVIHNFEIAA